MEFYKILQYFIIYLWFFIKYNKGDNFCNDKSVINVETPCRPCNLIVRARCPVGTVKGFRRMKSCSIKNEILGCHLLCKRTIEIGKCCSGFWGKECEECPGGANRPCNRHGTCNDTIEGSGECTCQGNFTGYACERCTSDTVYGKDCNKECQCVNGKCDNGIMGDGSCTCDSGYSGKLCDQELEACKNRTCPDNSRCIDFFGHVMCACNYGYKHVNLSANGTNDTVLPSCVEINRCEEYTMNSCHENATCTPTGPSVYNCSCLPGYHGDGYACDPIDPCQVENGGCDSNTSVCQYNGPGKHTCKCLDGYEMDHILNACQMIDVCSVNSSYCDEHATCSNTGPLQFKCTCNEGYGGTGGVCYNNIADLVKDLNTDEDTAVKGQMIYASRLISKYYYKELRNDGPFTLFIPLDRGFNTVLGSQSFEEFMADADTARQVLRQHILVGQWTLSQLGVKKNMYTLQGVPAVIQAKYKSRDKSGDVYYRYKFPGSSGTSKTTVVKGDIYAANGIVHVIGKMLTKDPEVKGDVEKSMLDLIKDEGQYNRLQSLIAKAGMKADLEVKNITVFTPENSAWDNLPVGALDYFTSPEGIDSLRQIILNHIFDGVIEVAELINLRRIRSKAGVEISVNVTDNGQILLNSNVGISQTDIPAKNGLYHHIKAVLLPADVNSLLPSQCDEVISEIVVGSCGPCHGYQLTCPSSMDVAIEGEVRTGCKYLFPHINTMWSGCSQVCNRSHIQRRCCPNFYSIDCYPCPGGFQNPCSGNGQCLDKVEGNGTCVCNPGYAGTLCNECKDPNMYGPYCNQTCTCMKGTCKNTIDSDGQCKKCDNSLYMGDNCDKKQMFCSFKVWGLMGNGFCHVNAFCYRRYKCKCKLGYEGDGREECNEIDPCQAPDRGGCHLQAQCIHTGPGENVCQCEAGWVGDGSYCYRSIHCEEHTDCHTDAICRLHWTKTQTLCVCKDGFHGNGTYCVPNDPCSVNKGNCHKKANCITLGLGVHSCTCMNGYSGDGYICIPTIYKVIEDDSRLTKLFGFLQKLGNEDLLLSLTDNFTFFAPNDVAMDIVISRMESSYWNNSDNILNFIRFHTLPGLYNIQMLLSYDLAHIRMPTLYDGFSLSVFKINFSTSKDNLTDIYVGASPDTKLVSGIIQKDISAVNGYVHIINKALEPFFPPSDTPMLDEFFNNHPEYSMFGGWLEMRNMMDNIMMNMMQYTLLVPDNSAMIGHNISFVQSRYLKFYVLPKIRLLSSFDDGETVPTVLGTTQQLTFTNVGDQVYVNDVLISSPNMITAGGVVHGIEGLLSPILHQCNVTNVNTVFGECNSCSLGYYSCPKDFNKVDKAELIRDCYYPYHDGYSQRGCRGLCERKTTVQECCQGYYGPNCQECPGGAEFPCNDNGVCHNGLAGTGMCLCQPGFNGTACEFRDVNGTLKSWSLSCLYNNGGCSPNATCVESVDDRTVCTCNHGLIGDGSQCLNPCDLDNGGCHISAQCIFIENYGRNCSCFDGYEGDGELCTLLKMSDSSSVWIYTVPVVGTLIILAILTFIGLFIYWRKKMSGFMMIFDRKNSTSSSSFEPLQPDDEDNETMISQPSTPPDINFCNPLYNMKDEFNDM